ncbi:MAG: universal stress protein [Gemmatimonadaceae bacterium]
MSETVIEALLPAAAALVPPRVDLLLVAIDSSSDHTAALASARWLSEATEARVQVLTVAPLVLELGSAYGLVPLAAATHQPQRDAALAAVKRKVVSVVGAERQWPVLVEFGEPVQVIARAASTNNAQLIVVERAHPSRAARFFGRDLVPRLLQVGDTPVFSAVPGQESLPKRVVIATDLSAMSDYAAQTAMPFIPPDATIYVVNVRPHVDAFDSAWESDSSVVNGETRDAALQRGSDALARDGTTIEMVSLNGDAADEILKFATSRDADLIVTATHGYGFFRRLVLGSVATQLLRTAACSVLCVPGSAQVRAAMFAASAHAVSTRSYDAVEWASALDEFSKRNTGRHCTIEIDQGDLGAQLAGTNLPFVGAVYEPHGNVAELMFGETVLVGRHRTSSVSDVSDISIATDENGEDRSLRIVNPRGQTLLIFSSDAGVANDAASD